ncbi:thioredoxin family protein [Candidatus Nitrospira bockiana]
MTNMTKRRVEVFTAGCPICNETVNLIRSVACPSCEVHIYDLRAGCSTNECREKAGAYGITAVPAIAVDGVLLECCRRVPITASALQAAGIGRA